MKINCQCGERIVDSTDYLPHKAHFVSDQDFFPFMDAIDDEVIDRVATGQLSKDDACMAARNAYLSRTRTMWQCNACGRLYVDDNDRKLHCFVPDSAETDKQILRSNKNA